MAEKKKEISLRRLIANDKSLIVVALLLALIIWIITSLNIGTDETKTISVDVPIKLGDEFSEQLGMQYFTLQDTVTLNVTLSGAKYVIGQVDEDDLNIKFDTSNVSRAGDQTIPILVTNKSKTKDFTIASTYPASIDAYFDVSESKTMNVTVNYDASKVADGYIFGDPVTSEDKVVLNGPKTYVDRVESIDADVNFGTDSNITETYKTDCMLQLVGSGVNASYINITTRGDEPTELKSVSVTLPVLKEVDLPVKVEFEDMPDGLPSSAINTVYSVDTVHAGVLSSANVKTAVIGKINFHEIGIGSKSYNFDVTSLQGISILDKNVRTINVTVTVSSQYEEQIVEISPSQIQIEGIPEGFSAKVKSVDDDAIEVIAPVGTVIDASNLTMVCDVSDINDDSLYPITISISNKNAWVHSSYNAVIELIEEDA